MKTFGNIYLLLLVAFFSACNDPYEDSTYQVYDMNPISSYLEHALMSFPSGLPY